MSAARFAEDYDSNASVHDQYYDSYADLGVHRVMLADAARMSFYQRIICSCSKLRDGIVVDVGSGTGILSMWAARAGAKHVFSIEASSLSSVQGEVFADNGLNDTITVLGETVENIIAEGAEEFVKRHRAVLGGNGISVLVSEWMGFYLLHEGMLPSVIRARNFFTHVNALLDIQQPIEMVPEHASLHVAPISCHCLYLKDFHEFWHNIGGLDLSRYGRMEYETHLEQAVPLVETLPAACLLHEGAQLAQLDLRSVTEDAVVSLGGVIRFNFRESSTFQRALSAGGSVGGPVVVDGFTLWFDVACGDTRLSTSPLHPPTHWKQTTVLLPAAAREERLVAFSSSDTEMSVEVHLTATDESLRCYTIDFELQ
ncbi:hypothetical protein ERJ75_001455000 [Trypanosoma vivax]|nr:hypothetical protein ERJ75_001455000 [Trypanosoma vivax]